MLSYIDSPLFVKVYRDDPVTRRRLRLAVIVKSTFDVRLDRAASASPSEETEIADVISKYRAAGEVQARADALRFPEIARTVTEYYAQCTQPVERKLIAGAVIEALRGIRKADKARLQS